jgi:hypothetical protein
MFHSMTILEQLTPLPKSRTIEGRLKLAVNILRGGWCSKEVGGSYGFGVWKSIRRG